MSLRSNDLPISHKKTSQAELERFGAYVNDNGFLVI
jgi:hypothetical protein